MSRLLLLVTPPKEGNFHNDNHVHLARAFDAMDWAVVVQPHTYVLEHELSEFDLVWPVGFGPREGYDARVTALSEVPISKIVTPAVKQRALHSKSAWLTHAPETHLSKSAEALQEVAKDEIAKDQGRWVLKPNAGSFGRAVQLITDPKQIALPNSEEWLLQRYVEEIVDGEYRTIIAGSEVIGTYKRLPQDGFKANLSQSAQALEADLPDGDRAIVASTHQSLMTENIGFAAIDTCAGFVMEVNVANPGGISTLEKIYGGNPAVQIANAVLAILEERA